MKLVITSQGLARNTTVRSAETGEVLEGVTAIDIAVRLGEPVRATIEIEAVEMGLRNVEWAPREQTSLPPPGDSSGPLTPTRDDVGESASTASASSGEFASPSTRRSAGAMSRRTGAATTA